MMRISDRPRAASIAASLIAAALIAAALCAVPASAGPRPSVAEPPSSLRPGLLDLAGEWRAYLGDHPAGADPDLDDGTWQRVELPSGWLDLDLDDPRQPIWLRRTAELPADWDHRLSPSGLAVRIAAAPYGAYELYAGGELVGTHGDLRPGGFGAALPAADTRVFRIPGAAVGDGGRLQLALVFRRVVWPRDRLTQHGGPVGGQIAVGDFETLRTSAEIERLEARRRSLPAFLLAALLAAIGGYHLQLFVLRRRSREYLWFGLLVLALAAFTLTGALPALDEGLRRRWMAALGHGSVALLIQFLWLFFGRPITRPLRAYQLSHVGLALVLVVVPLGWIAATQPLRWLWGLPAILLLGDLLVGSMRSGKNEMTAISLGAVSLPAAHFAEVVFEMRGAVPAVPLPALAFSLLAGTMAVSVSSRYTRAHRQLDRFRQQLEQMVEDQTDELGAAHRKLQSEAAERKLVEEAMRMLERAVEQSVDGIAVTDLAGGSEFLNEAWARMHGYEVFEVLGYDLVLFHTPEQMQEQVYPLMKEVREQGSFQGEIWHRKKDGTLFPTWMSATRLTDPGGEPVGMVAIARDVTRRRQAAREQLQLEEKAQQAETLSSLANLAAGIAHDYNNLLTGVLGNVDQILRELPHDFPARAKIRQIEAAAERAATLSDQLLAYAGEDQLTFKTVAINDLVNGMRDELSRLVPSRVELDFDLNDGLPPVDLDPRQIRQVILNLFHNACESIGDDRGVITLRTSKVDAGRGYFEGAFFEPGHREGRYVFFEVSDSGCGIEEDARTRLFDPFFSTKGTGRGLGLATVLGIVRAHGGAIKIYSQVGRGTTLEVLFPASVKEPAAAVEDEEVLDEWKGLGTVLVADDEQLIREVSQDILEQHDFKVLMARDGREAVEIYRQRGDEVRVVLLDLTMPNLDGEGAFREIRELNPEAVIVLMSGYSRKRAGARLAAEGLAGFLHKPFRPDDLIRTVRGALGQ